MLEKFMDSWVYTMGISLKAHISGLVKLYTSHCADLFITPETKLLQISNE
jgi:hypothetical protein